MASYTTAATKKEKQEYDALAAAKPVEQTSQHQTAFDTALDRLINREKFTYDADSDPLFAQYKDTYTRQGKLAMKDAIGHAAAMTGGYGNSYAQTAAQQVYSGYMSELSDKIPALQELARAQYDADTADLQNRVSLLGSAVDRDHQLYREKVSDWESALSRAYTEYSHSDATDLNERNIKLEQASIDAQNDANTIAAAKANTMSVDDYYTFMDRMETVAEDGEAALRDELNIAVRNEMISEETAKAIMQRFFGNASGGLADGGWRDQHRMDMSELARQRQKTTGRMY